MHPEITGIEHVEFDYPLEHVGTNATGSKLVYEPGNTHRRRSYALRVDTDAGVTGEYVGGNPPAVAQIDMVADHLIGENPFHRERLWTDLKRALRQYDRTGIGPLDIALWDIAGKHAGQPIHELLGTYRRRLPAYASSYFGGPNGGFETPEAYADFAASCLDAGYPAFKLHSWVGIRQRSLDREIETIRAVRERVGPGMDLMYDPVCEYDTLADALQVGRACDECDYYWYEDPYGDGGASQHGHRILRQRLETPLLQTELVRGVEPHADFAAAEATDFLRADVEWDGGITGAMKIARLAEGLGLDVEYHLAGPAVRHCMAATRNSNYYELGLIHPDADVPHTQAPIYRGGYTDRVDAIRDDGTFPVPSDPGLGVEYDWDYIRSRAVDRAVHGRAT